MEHERLILLLARIESGEATDADLNEFETLLAQDYEAREAFLDHTQLEGMLHGAGSEVEQATILAFEEPQSADPHRSRMRLWAATASAAVAVIGIALFWSRPSDGPAIKVAQIRSNIDSAPTPLSAEERYDRSRMNLGGASLAHPETAGSAQVANLSGAIEFNRDIRPILSDKCFFCHGPDAAERKADLRLDMEEGAKADLGGYAAITPGDPDASELIARILDDDPNSVMPPPESSRTLTSEQKELLRRWVEQGAEWQKHWAFEKPAERKLPEISKSDWAQNEIDPFVARKLEEKGLSPSPAADPATLIRRVSLDLTGLPPTVEEVDAFLDDPSDQAYRALVDRLLDSDAHAEHMAWQWMDAARYADTDGYQNDGPRDMWRWRDWVIEAYRSNLPFDQFTIEQLAGDLLPDPTRDQLIATGFNRNNRYNSEAGLVLEEFLLENAVDRVDTTMTVWMGLTMGCARCHDHKYDPLSQRDYYQLVSYFDNITESGRAIKQGNSEPWIKAPTHEQEAELAKLDDRLSKARKALEKKKPILAREQATWESTQPDLSEPIAIDGLSHHFAIDTPIVADGRGPVNLENKIDGLICNHRFSIAFDMIPETVNEGAVLSDEIPGTTRKGIFVAFRDGHLRFSITSRWVAGVGMLETKRLFEPGERVHIVLTNDGTQRTRGMGIWVDGKQVETREIYNTNSNTSKFEATMPMLVGGSKHLPNWKGRLSDLRFYTGRTLKTEVIEILSDPTPLSEILAKPHGARTGIEQRKIRDYFLTHAADAPLKALADRVDEVETERIRFVDALPTTMIMEEASKPAQTHLRIRGEYHNQGEPVESAIPEIFGKPTQPVDTRLGFAKWLVSEENPLAARVAVNRYWQMLFGTGLVKTTEDFGTQGSLPTHPDLLDWLALEFVDSGWDIRHLLKLMVTSRTYRQSSEVRKELLVKDPENVFLARAPRLKLPGNTLRDQALFASGLLVPAIGGPSVKPYQPANLWKEASNFSYKQDSGDALYRRSLYTYWKRTLAPPSMAVLDTADREWCSVKPKRTNTPLQALTLLNETAFFEAARKLGERMLTVEKDEERMAFGFRTVLAREPSARELDILTNAYSRYLKEFSRDPGNAAALQKVGESTSNPENDPAEIAAAAAVANVIINLEEASVRE